VEWSASCAIDFAHAARAQGPKDFVRPEIGAGGQCHFFSSAVQFVTKTSGVDTLSGDVT